MKSNNNILFKIWLFIALTLGFRQSSLAQEKFNLSAGVGLPEFFILGVRYQIPQAQFGFNLGYLYFRKKRNYYK